MTAHEKAWFDAANAALAAAIDLNRAGIARECLDRAERWDEEMYQLTSVLRRTVKALQDIDERDYSGAKMWLEMALDSAKRAKEASEP